LIINFIAKESGKKDYNINLAWVLSTTLSIFYMMASKTM